MKEKKEVKTWQNYLGIDKIKEILEVNKDINKNIKVINIRRRNFLNFNEEKDPIRKDPCKEKERPSGRDSLIDTHDDISGSFGTFSKLKTTWHRIIYANDLYCVPHPSNNKQVGYNISLKNSTVSLPILDRLSNILKEYGFFARKPGFDLHSHHLMLGDLVQCLQLAEYDVEEEKLFKRRGELEISIEKNHPAYKALEILSRNTSKEEKKKVCNVKLKLVERNRVIVFPNEKLVKLYKEYIKTDDPEKFLLEESFLKYQPIFSTTRYTTDTDRITVYVPVALKELGKDILKGREDDYWVRNMVKDYEEKF